LDRSGTDRMDRTLEGEGAYLVFSQGGLSPPRILSLRERGHGFFCQWRWQAGNSSAGAGRGSGSSGFHGFLFLFSLQVLALEKDLEREYHSPSRPFAEILVGRNWPSLFEALS